MPIAVIAFDFDPLLRLGDSLTVRWQTVALAAVVAICLSAAGVATRRVSLRADDLLYVAIGAVPGAVVGGRIGFALMFPDAFRGGPMTLFDPSIGGLELGLAIVGGLLTGIIVAALLGTPPGRMAHAVAVPLLVALAAGKLTMALGGSGQGLPLEAPWATAYLGPGPWVSLAADVPSHPSQVYEGVATALVAALVVLATAAGAFRASDGSRLLVALAGWASVRAAAAVTWRDPGIIGSLPVGGLVAIVIAVGALVGLAILTVWLPRGRPERDEAAQPVWPDPETRPRF